jgi:hypothetical protein
VPHLKLVALWAVPRPVAPVAFLIAIKLAPAYDTATRVRLVDEIGFRQLLLELLESTEALRPSSPAEHARICSAYGRMACSMVLQRSSVAGIGTSCRHGVFTSGMLSRSLRCSVCSVQIRQSVMQRKCSDVVVVVGKGRAVWEGERMRLLQRARDGKRTDHRA